MTNTEPTRAAIVAFVADAWRIANEQAVARGKEADRYELTAIRRSLFLSETIWVVDYTLWYRLLGEPEHPLFSYYVLRQNESTGALEFVVWEVMQEEKQKIA